eukprot:gene5697-6123_t
MPIYAVLGIYYRTYSHRYAWTISPIFLSGTNPTIILMIFFVLFIIFMVHLVHILFKKAAQEYYDRHMSCYRIGLKWRLVSLWTIAWLINGVIMITADSFYVYLIIHRSTKYEYLIQITLALFKLGWHDIGIFRMIHKLKKIFAVPPDSNHSSSPISLEYTNLEAITVPMLSLPNTNEEEVEEEEQLLTLRISYTLAVMLVFGSLFPPLALISTIAIINITMLEEYLTKRMLDCSDLNTSDPDLNHSNYVEYLEEECFVLFDICGDLNGWSEGIIPFKRLIDTNMEGGMY